jgi:hypothetical protein
MYKRPNTFSMDYALSFSKYTELGSYQGHYHSLPRSIDDLCRLVKTLIIHPVARYRYANQIPVDRIDEDNIFSSVPEMLGVLLERNANLYDWERPPSEKLILSCRYHSILLASMLKYLKIPCRVRAGFATYLIPNKFIDHWVCEVWDNANNKWKIVDSDIWGSTDILNIDFDSSDVPSEKFLTAGYSWLKIRNKEVDPMLFGIMKWWGCFYVRDQLFHDIECIKNNERIYTDLPIWSATLCDDMTEDQLKSIDQAAKWTLFPDDYFHQILNITWTR